ncbi:DUF1294 domain-containing protein [Shewanella gelidii]|uniref:DUF1294 domain-containing protein n=1 Tax=Shewanella gelidii TaxID=1642821 RepID=A0A917JIH5_9GAMM|nr:hypothetical protein GCM10009332_03810 [Shewanella gelidii]
MPLNENERDPDVEQVQRNSYLLKYLNCIFAICFLGGLSWLVQQHKLPVFVSYIYIVFNGTVALAYLYDKWAAIRQHTRIAEYQLHILSLVGGWPLAAIMQFAVRHKISKPRFQFWFHITWLSHVSIFLAAFWLTYPS